MNHHTSSKVDASSLEHGSQLQDYHASHTRGSSEDEANPSSDHDCTASITFQHSPSSNQSDETFQRKERHLHVENVPCRQIIHVEPQDNDVCFWNPREEGQAATATINLEPHHPGNLHFRQWMQHLVTMHIRGAKDNVLLLLDTVTQELIDLVYSQGGRFLENDAPEGWYELSMTQARTKCHQLLVQEYHHDDESASG